jgi:hypothetical protein
LEEDLMNPFLKLIGDAVNPCPEPYKWSFVDFSRTPRQIRTGDHLILYAAGGRKRVFALAEVTSEVYAADHDARWPHRMDISYIVNLPPAVGVHIDAVSTHERNLLRSLMRQSYIKLTREEYARAATKLREAANVQ